MTITRAARRTSDKSRAEVSPMVSSVLKYLDPDDVKPSRNNPRRLFDPAPLNDLRESIKQHGVLVPILVYKIKGQNKYRILDGERRHRCCVQLREEGHPVKLPANVVDPPDKIAGLLYMFSVHNFREQWELMPTALSLAVVMEALGERDTEHLANLTGLSQPQIERCKVLLSFPERFQNLSLDPDPQTRIPSNFWIEAAPVLSLCQQILPDLYEELGRDGITEKLIDKYRAKAIKSVIHFRRIMEAFEVASSEDPPASEQVASTLREYISNTSLETRRAFDGFIADNRRVQSAIRACDELIAKLERQKLNYALEDREKLAEALNRVKDYLDALLEKLAGGDAPEKEIDTSNPQDE